MANNRVEVKQKQEDKQLINCLRNERIIVRHINRPTNMVSNPKHPLYGGMAENAVRVFSVPKFSSGRFANVLTDAEKNYLEEVMGLEPNALSIYKKKDNFWDDSNPDGISKVTLHKQDNYFDLRDTGDYIRYKILLTNKDFIASSLAELEEHPKATYQFVIIHEGDEVKAAKSSMNATMQCYKEYGKVEEDKSTLKFIVETLDGRPLASSIKLEILQAKINDLIQGNPKTFLNVITDPYLATKVLVRKGIDTGVLSRRGDYIYVRNDNKPLCEDGEEPTLAVAAKYLNNPKHQDLRFALEDQIKTASA